MTDPDDPSRRVIRTGALARVEGEGALDVVIRDGQVERVELRIFEPPRFFEAFLRGRHVTEAPDITARICGICPAAYQVSAMAAIEDLCGITVPEPVRRLRRLMYCGEWIQSHALHVFMLHAPDFLGYESGFAMALDHRDAVERGLSIRRAGNELLRVIGGREIHPINVRVGGFHRVPSRRELAPVAELLRTCVEPAQDSVRWLASLPFPEVEVGHDLVALRQGGDYPLERGRLASSDGIDLAPEDFAATFVEEQAHRSTALHARRRDRRAPYLVGPLARYALNASRLSPLASEAARQAGLGAACRNPFRSIVVRAVEILHAIEEALALTQDYEPPDRPAMAVVPGAGVGHGWSEAPRGLLYHRYRVDEDGTILEATIVPPTSQNQAAIERDLRDVVAAAIDLPDEQLAVRCEQAIRNHDPCISCATHFLTLRVDRR